MVEDIDLFKGLATSRERVSKNKSLLATHPERLKFDDLQIVATDRRSFCFNEYIYGWYRSKRLGRDNFKRIPNGVPGVKLELPLLLDGGVKGERIPLNRFVQVPSTARVRMFGTFPPKGATIAVVSDANSVLLDPARQHAISAGNHNLNGDRSLPEGCCVTDKVETIFLGGEVIIDGDLWLGRTGSGKYQKR